MASIKITDKGTYRAIIEKFGVRKCKTFPSLYAAEVWASAIEEKARRQRFVDTAVLNTVLATMIPKRMLAAIATIPHTLADVLEASIPAPNFTGIYFLIWQGEVVYVGQSVDLLHRISRHKREGKEFDSYSYLLCHQSQLNDLEATYITALMPWMNVTLGRVPRELNKV